MSYRRLPVFAAAALFLTAAVAQATRPQAWTFATQKDFAEGQFENTVVNSYGELTLGRTLTRIPTDAGAESVQAFAQTPDGAIYVATSPKAKVYRIDGGKSTVVYTAGKGFDDITAMAVDANGNLLVALSGETAKLVSISGDGKAELTRFQQEDVDYIWAIQPVADGTVYLGTGPHGKVYKIAAGGGDAAASVVLETGQKNVTALAWDGNKNLVAGTDARGLVIRVDAATGKPFVLLDAGKVDVNGMVSDAAGNLYVATAKAEASDQSGPGGEGGDNTQPEEPETKSKPSVPEKEPIQPPAGDEGGGMSPQGRGPDFSGVRVILGAASPELPADLKALLKKAAAEKPTKAAGGGKPKAGALRARAEKAQKMLHAEESEETPDTSTVYKIGADGVVSTLLQDEGSNYSLLLAGNELLIGTGDEGKLYAYQLHDESTTLVARVKEQQISTIFADRAGTIFLGTGNMAQVYQMGASLADSGTFTSQALDASHTAAWGHAILQATQAAGAKITISTRSGNTEDVDANPKFWSEWSDAGDGSKIVSPEARFLQFRVTLQGDGKTITPTVDDLRIAYQTRNLAPRIKSVSLELPGAATGGDDDADSGGGGDDSSSPPATEKPLHVSWDANDPNGDGLVFRLYYKQVTADGTDLWTPLARDLKDPTYEWDTRSVPDGKYQVKVVASDSPDNPPDTALETARSSAPFMINHTPPTLSDVAATVDGNRVTVTGKAKDGLSAVTDVRYQVDGQIAGGGSEDWQPAAASDKIFDSPEEAFTLTTRPLSTGPHRITVRATDAAGNSSYKAVTIHVKS
jgi:hypothetical protein